MGVYGRFTARASKAFNERGIYLGRRSTRVHVAIYRTSGGRVGGHLPGWPEARIVLVDHVGAKTGRRRTSPLICHEENGSVAIVASKAGQPTNPAWFHNLMANPETTIQLGRERRPVRARLAEGKERERIWEEFVGLYPGYRFYAEHAKGRRIPVLVLDPR